MDRLFSSEKADNCSLRIVWCSCFITRDSEVHTWMTEGDCFVTVIWQGLSCSEMISANRNETTRATWIVSLLGSHIIGTSWTATAVRDALVSAICTGIGFSSFLWFISGLSEWMNYTWLRLHSVTEQQELSGSCSCSPGEVTWQGKIVRFKLTDNSLEDVED